LKFPAKAGHKGRFFRSRCNSIGSGNANLCAKGNSTAKAGTVKLYSVEHAVPGPNHYHHHKAELNGMASPLFGPDFSRIPIGPPSAAPPMKRAIQKSGLEGVAEPSDKKALTKAPNALIQCKPENPNEPTDQRTQKEEKKKAELEFHSTIAFVGTNSGSSSTGPSQEGFSVLQIKWLVWNTGWEAAPAHVDRVTIYNADRCSGCRDEKDEMLKAEVEAPATRPIAQPGDGEYKYESISPMVAMTIRAGHYDAYVDLDVYDEVEEINKDNNTIFTSFYVRPPDKSDPDLEGEEESTGPR
jgi:hypothetical protein